MRWKNVCIVIVGLLKMTETCQVCSGFIIAGSCKCEYNKNHGIHTYHTISNMVDEGYDIDAVLYNIESLQARLTDGEIQTLCNLYSNRAGGKSLNESDKLFMELHHLNEVLII